MSRKKILFVLPIMPWPLNTGGNQAMFNGIAALLGSADIFISFPIIKKDVKGKDYADFKKELGSQVIILPFVRTPKKRSLVERLAGKVVKELDERFVRSPKEQLLEKELQINQVTHEEITFINNIIRDNQIDTVQVEMLPHLSLVNTLPNHVRKIFVHHEIGFVRKKLILEELGADSSYWSRLDSYKICEIGLLNKYDDIIVLSEIDKLKLEQAGVKVPIHSSFAVVKLLEGNYKPQLDDCHKLFFIGAPKHRPNYLAVKWFLENCWSKLLSKDDRYSLEILGVWDDDLIKEITGNYQNIHFLGFVPDLADVLKDGIMIVPITVGSGIRMKILESANYGIPVVSTSIGAEGLPVTDGENVFLADNPDDFVNDILKLKDRDLRIKFSDALKEMIRNKYSLEALMNNRRQIVDA